MTLSGTPSDNRAAIRDQVEQMLGQQFDRQPQTEVLRAARYLTLGRGHRWRSLLTVASSHIFQPRDSRIVLPLACALEILHAASLALDDLPSMDNAKTRRGKPCLHLVFPRWVTDMVPAFLVNMAYTVYADNPLASEERRIQGILLLGEMGAKLAQGQELDLALSGSRVSESALLECYALKSGALFAAALAGAGILCGGKATDVAALRESGLTLGQAYQFLDDLSESPDQDAGKCTAVTLLGLAGARIRAQQLLADAVAPLSRFGPAAQPLCLLIQQLQTPV